MRTLRFQLDRQASYGLVYAGSFTDASGFAVRYDLAPRRPIYLGEAAAWRADPSRFDRLPVDLTHIVVAFPDGEAPRLFTRQSFALWLRESDAP